jgi:Uma2 family endonuclease
MTPTAPAGLMTAEEFYDWANRPENADRRWELEDGVPVEVSSEESDISPGELHGVVCWLVARLLGNYLFARGAGYLCTNDTGLLVRRGPDTVRGPDVTLYLAGKPVGQLSRKYATDVPALVVEVMSPTDTHRRTTRRVGQYLKRGVPVVWVVEPDDRVVYVHKADEFTKVLEGDEPLTGNGVLPDFACKVSDLFALPGLPPAA